MDKEPLYELMRSPEPDEKNLAMLAHLLTMAGFLIPGLNIIVPLVIWMYKRDQSHFVAMHAKESLNFQITIALFVAFWVVLKLMLVGLLLLPLVFVLAPFFIIALLIIVIRAGLKASSGEEYRYPLCLRLIN